MNLDKNEQFNIRQHDGTAEAHAPAQVFTTTEEIAFASRFSPRHPPLSTKLRLGGALGLEAKPYLTNLCWAGVESGKEKSFTQLEKEEGERNQSRVRLTERDKAIIEIIFDHGFVTFELVFVYFFPGLETRIAKDRLRLLVRAGVLKLTNRNVGLCEQCLCLGPVGKLWASENLSTPDGFKGVRGIPHEFNHERELIRLRLELERRLPPHVFSTYHFYKFKNKTYQPDGMIQIGNKAFSIELEINKKDHDRYVDLHKQMDGSVNMTACLYFAASSRAFNALKDSFLERFQSKKVYIIKTEDFYSLGDPHFVSCQGRVPLREIL